jgi:hypothetical protein
MLLFISPTADDKTNHHNGDAVCYSDQGDDIHYSD